MSHSNARRHVAEAHGLVGEPLERRVQNNEVAEHRADDEQGHGGGEGGHEPLALAGLQRRQEEREQLPQNDGGRGHNARPQRDLEAHGERLEGIDGLKRGHAVDVGQKLSDGHEEELAHGRGGHVEHDHGHGEAGHDAHKAHAQLAEVVE